jgi:hypothetical protein
MQQTDRALPLLSITIRRTKKVFSSWKVYEQDPGRVKDRSQITEKAITPPGYFQSQISVTQASIVILL